MSRSLLHLSLALLLVGCDSQMHLTGTPQLAALPSSQAVRATAVPGAAGTTITIDDPSVLPSPVRMAADLKAVIGQVSVAVTRMPNGSYVFTIPAGSKPPQDVAGNYEIVFVMDERLSQVVELNTGSPVQFGQPPVQTNPAGGSIALGLDIFLTANIATSTANVDNYQFTWSASTSAQGPWQPIPGQGKQVKWTPAAAGNYFIKIDAVDPASQQVYSTVTPAAVVFVTQPKDIIQTDPTSGAIQRGNAVTVKFNTPSGLTGANLSYAWSYGLTANGPWTTITGSGSQVTWLPTDVGNYFLKADVSNKDTGAVNTFVSPQAVVFVSESKPIVTADHPNAKRGDRINLTLNVPNPGSGPFAWYYARTSGPSTSGGSPSLAGAPGTWVPLIGTGSSISTVTTDAGTYNFRVDIPQPDGSVKSFTTTNPVLNVTEPTPILHTTPAFTSFNPGSSTSLTLEATGVDEVNYHYLWYVSTNPAAGWTSLPFDAGNDQTKKSFTITGNTTARYPSGSYYARADAIANDGSVTYSFISSAPVFTVTNAVVR